VASGSLKVRASKLVIGSKKSQPDYRYCAMSTTILLEIKFMIVT